MGHIHRIVQVDTSNELPPAPGTPHRSPTQLVAPVVRKAIVRQAEALTLLRADGEQPTVERNITHSGLDKPKEPQMRLRNFGPHFSVERLRTDCALPTA